MNLTKTKLYENKLKKILMNLQVKLQVIATTILEY